jgi:acid phosphatase
MRSFLALAALILAAALPAAASAATPPADFVPAPKTITLVKDHSKITQLDDGGGGLPYLGVTHPYDAGDWESTLVAYHDNGTYDREIMQVANLADREVVFASRRQTAKPQAIVFDVDETVLSNYSAILADEFTFGTASQNEATDEIGKAILPTRKVFDDAKAGGLTVFFITGRPEAQRQPTEENLAREGFTGYKHLYLKPPNTTLTTVQYKTAARKDIAAQGYRIVVNVGDQFSDLVGGHADNGYKLPNPFYYLP